jgi:hypothetical protein
VINLLDKEYFTSGIGDLLATVGQQRTILGRLNVNF